MSRQNWDEEEGYEQPLFIFPDDEEESEYEAVPVVFDDDEGAPAAPPEDPRDPEGGISVASAASVSAEPEYDTRVQRDPGRAHWDTQRRSPIMRRSSGSSAPVEYPEGSLGSFSTPEDYQSHASSDSQAPEEEYDSPIFLFPPDEVEDEDEWASVPAKKQEEPPAKSRNRLSSSTDDGDLDDSIGISFSRYSAESKEGEFFFMPFLDIPDEVEDEEEEEEEEEISFSFRKVDAEQVKKEKEFIFMPFLNTSEEEPEEEEPEEDPHSRRSIRGVIFDEGLYLIPMESEEEEVEEEKEEEHEDDEEDSGIYVVSSVGGVVPTAPKVQRTDERKTTLKSENRPAPGKKKSKKPAQKQQSQSGKKPASKGGKSSAGKANATAEEQFRAAMRNVSPEIRAAVKNDPVQRAALEQAVRIALVQQAAQEAVEKATGRPVFGGTTSAVSSRKKKRIPKPPQSQSRPVNSFLGGSSRANSMSFSPITLRTPYDDGGVSEFGVTDEKSTTTEFGTSSQPAVQSTAATAAASATGTPDSNQDPVMSLLNGQNGDAAQDSALDALTGKTGQKSSSSYQSPAAVRAAMRTGSVDFDSLQTAAAPAAAKTTLSAAEQEMQAKRSGCLIWIIVAFIVFFVGLIGILVLPNISKQNNYDEAISLMNSGNYLQAIEIFETFRESDTKYYDDSRLYISDCAYKQASLYYNAGKYYEAYNLLLDKATVNEETTQLALSSNYYYAEQRYTEGDWQTAAAAYANLIGTQYEDSQEKYNICQYQLASQNAEQGKYLQAYQGFALLGDYSDALFRSACMICKAWVADSAAITSARLMEGADVILAASDSPEAQDILNSVYAKASEFDNAGQHTIAYEGFYALGGYSDSAYRSALAMYHAWNSEPNYGTLHRREEAMEALRSAMGNDEAVAALSSSGFNQIRLMGEWSDGESYLSLRRVNESTDNLVLSFRLMDGDGTAITVETEHIGFDGNVVYRLTDPEDSTSKQLLFEVTGFDSLVAMQPGSFSFFCLLNSSEYALVRG